MPLNDKRIIVVGKTYDLCWKNLSWCLGTPWAPRLVKNVDGIDHTRLVLVCCWGSSCEEVVAQFKYRLLLKTKHLSLRELNSAGAALPKGLLESDRGFLAVKPGQVSNSWRLQHATPCTCL